jgi:hypothetical protein
MKSSYIEQWISTSSESWIFKRADGFQTTGSLSVSHCAVLIIIHKSNTITSSPKL